MSEAFKPTLEQSQGLENGSDWSILEQYALDERRRVDRLKRNLQNGEYDWQSHNTASKKDTMEKYQREKIDLPPSTLRKLGRIALDIAHINFAPSEERRNREAMSTAIREFNQEEAERTTTDTILKTQVQMSREIEEIMREDARKKENEEKERTEFEKDMIIYTDAHRQLARKQFHNDRAQELLERYLNDTLTKIEDLEIQAQAGNPEVQKRHNPIVYEGVEIPVYDLKGYPISMISHAIDYRVLNSHLPYKIGVQTMQQLLEHPDLWGKHRKEIVEHPSFGTDHGDARSDAISASYVSSEAGNLSSRIGGQDFDSKEGSYIYTCYGFDHLEADSVINFTLGDAGTPTDAGQQPTKINSFVFDKIEKLGDQRGYNEIALRRYFENGAPRIPDYIITENNRISKAALRHAAYFEIPIVNIDRRFYPRSIYHNSTGNIQS